MSNDTRRLAGLLAGAQPVPAPREDIPYFEAIGRLIVEYAAAESALHILARKLSGLSDAKARAIFAGMRLSDLTDRIRHMMRLDNIPDDWFADIDGCLVQLDKIATKRHNLVHRQVNYRSGAVLVSNWLTAKSVSTAEEDSLDMAALEAMKIDCIVISLRLNFLADPELAASNADIRRLLHLPWRYTPPQPKKKTKQPRKAH
jgi:hypothetical protein